MRSPEWKDISSGPEPWQSATAEARPSPVRRRPHGQCWGLVIRQDGFQVHAGIPSCMARELNFCHQGVKGNLALFFEGPGSYRVLGGGHLCP
jgi:hypothetical protein